MKVNYSLYLVTDNTNAILGDRDLCWVVEEAVKGGVTVVQLRDKTSETAELIRIAKRLHNITKGHDVPLLINDRVDVAFAAGAEGVHLGQDDMDIETARKLLGPNAIIGVTASSREEARQAVEGGADYLGIGTLFTTPTKENTKFIIGTSGTRDILDSLASLEQQVSTVCIGGINATNAQRVLYQSRSPSKGLDGIAVVSAIMAAPDPRKAAQDLRELVTKPPRFAAESDDKRTHTVDEILSKVPEIVAKVGAQTPLCHNMTNLVVQNFAANVALCIGASPIMANNGDEAEDLCQLGGALVVNMGTVTPDGLQNYLKALRSYNAVGGPVLFDPVGAGATKQRREAVKSLMAGGYFDLIKGNEGEIKTVSGANGVQQRGVDSGASTLSLQEKATLVARTAARERNIILMTGKTDLISDGSRTFAINNGHEYLGEITGSGCTLGTTVAAFMAVHREDKLLAAIAGIFMYEIAAEQAAKRDDVRGPGTFVPAFLDEMSAIKKQTTNGQTGWLSAANIERVNS